MSPEDIDKLIDDRQLLADALATLICHIEQLPIDSTFSTEELLAHTYKILRDHLDDYIIPPRGDL